MSYALKKSVQSKGWTRKCVYVLDTEMGDGGRRYVGGNSEQKIIAETNIHVGDLCEIDKNDRTQKTVAKTDQKRSKKRLLLFF